MSIDVNYYSFSPSRADSSWPEFIEDLKALRTKYAVAPKPPSPEDLELRKKIDAAEIDFEKRLKTQRKKIFDFFSQRDHLIPWIEWDQEQGTNIHLTDKEKIEYLRFYGPTFPRGADPRDKNVHPLMLNIHAPELLAEHDRLIDERNRAINGLLKQFTPVRQTKDDVLAFTDRQKKLSDETDLSYLKYEIEHDKKQLLQDLKELDIYYGSVVNLYFENPRSEHACLQALTKAFSLKNEKGIPSREEWIRLYESLNREALDAANEYLAEEFSCGKDEAATELIGYLRSVKPVVQDLKGHSDAVFLRSYGGEPRVDPASIENLLLERAEKHAQKFKGRLPPVL